MVKLNNAMKNDKQIFMGMARAKDLFTEVATSTPIGDENDEPAICFQDFAKLIGKILNESNTAAKKKGRPTVAIPSIKDLKVLFDRADADNSKSVDEYEFLGLYQQVMDGNVKGLGDSAFSFYVRPHQLMQFGQHEHHPDTDWQDLFFDLLFVGGAFQTGNFLKSILIAEDEHVLSGLLWSFAIFLSLAQQWFMKMLLSARFGYSSMFHYFLDNIEFVLLAYAMWHIPGEDVVIERNSGDDASSYGSGYGSGYSSYSSYGSAYGSRRQLGSGAYGAGSGDFVTYTPLQQLQHNIHGRTFGFSLCIALNNLLYIFKWMEIITDPNASPGAVTISRHQAGAYMGVCFIFCGATRMTNNDIVSIYTMYVWMLGNVLYIASFYYWVMFLHGRKREGRLATSGVPMNVSYVIHRVGEFCMLMIGETVLSLLVVAMEKTSKSYLMFGVGMLIACNLHFHHFSTYPPDPSKHVLHKGTFDYRSLSYICIMIYLYPFCLILIGICLKVLLKKADYGIVLEDTNWTLAAGICAEYFFINFFVYIHDKSLGKALKWKPFATRESTLQFFKLLFTKGSTCLLILVLASLELRPYPMLMYSGLVIILQSCLILYYAPVEENKDKDDIAQMDLEYSKARHSTDSQFSVSLKDDKDVMDVRCAASLDRPTPSGGGRGISLDTHASGGGHAETKEGDDHAFLLLDSPMSQLSTGSQTPKSSLRREESPNKHSSTRSSKHVKMSPPSKMQVELTSDMAPLITNPPSMLKTKSDSGREGLSSNNSSSSDSSSAASSTDSSTRESSIMLSNANKTPFSTMSKKSGTHVPKIVNARKTVELLKELGLLTAEEIKTIESRLLNK